MTGERPGPAHRPSVLGIDYTAAAGHAPGVGRYVRELVRAHVRLPQSDTAEYRLHLAEYGRAPRVMAGAPLGLADANGASLDPSLTHRRVSLPRRALRWVDGLPGASRRLIAGRADLFHRVHPDWPPIGRTRTSIAVAEFPTPGTEASAALARAAANAAGVIVFSSNAKQRVQAEFGVDAARVHASPVGCEHWLRDLDELPTRRPERDILVLGAIRSSRRPLDVLHVFEALRDQGERARLLLVGRPGDAAAPFRDALRASPAARYVEWIDDPIESRMPACVAGASVLLHLADDEASPVTPLEATRMGVPVVASPLPAFREVLDGVARWADSTDPAQTAAALADALQEADDPGAAERLGAVARPYTWEACARAHRGAWRSMLDSRPTARS